MLRIPGVIAFTVLLTACGSTTTKTASAEKNQPAAAPAAETTAAAKPKQVCRLEKQIGTNQKTRVCKSK